MSLELPPYEIGGWQIRDDDFDMSVRVNGFRFTIPVSPECFVNSPRELSIFLAKSSTELLPTKTTIHQPDFERLAHPVLHTGKLTLADLAVRGSFTCEYRVIDEKPTAMSVTERVLDDSPPPPEWDMRLLQNSFPLFDAADIEVPYDDGRYIYDIIPQRVFVRGQQLFYKVCWSPSDAVDEVGKYSRICTSDLPTLQRSTSRLFEIVAGRDGLAKGLLYDWIQTKETGTLTDAISPETPALLREKWALQIRETVEGLHTLGVVWSDVKPDNVLIDENDNAIVIDLEGGTTDGWVDRELGGSVEGDLQGLERLVNFILNGQSPVVEDDMDSVLSYESP